MPRIRASVFSSRTLLAGEVFRPWSAPLERLGSGEAIVQSGSALQAWAGLPWKNAGPCSGESAARGWTVPRMERAAASGTVCGCRRCGAMFRCAARGVRPTGDCWTTKAVRSAALRPASDAQRSGRLPVAPLRRPSPEPWATAGPSGRESPAGTRRIFELNVGGGRANSGYRFERNRPTPALCTRVISPASPEAQHPDHRERQKDERVGLWRERQFSEETVVFIHEAGCEEDSIGIAPRPVVPIDQGPEISDDEGIAAAVLQGPEECAAVRIEGVDRTVAEIPDEQVIGECFKPGGGDVEPPRRVERVARPGIDEPLDEGAIGCEHVDESVACPGLIVVTARGLQGKADVELTIQDSQVEWRPVLPRRCPRGEGRKARIRDVFDEAETRVVHLDGPSAEVRRVEEGAPANGRDGQALVDRPVGTRIIDPFERLGRIDGTASPRNRAVFSDKDEVGASRRGAVRYDECRRITVEHLPGRGRAARRLTRRREDRDRARGRHLHAGRRIERGDSHAVVRYPEGTRRSERDAPWIDQIGIDMRRRGEAQARENCLVISHETRELKGSGVGRCDHA